MATIFTRIVRGEIPSYKVAEDERFFAFLDINPLTKGHTLVVPKQETDYLFDLGRPHAGRYDRLCQANCAKTERENRMQKGGGRRTRTRSSACPHPPDPDSRRKRRGFPQRKAQTIPRRISSDSRYNQLIIK